MEAENKQFKRGFRFWMIMLVLVISSLMAYLEATIVATALPTIAQDLRADEFVWVGTGYALAFTAILPMTGGLADAFGRRIILVTSLVLFTIGGALAGTAKNMNWLVAGRTILGLGAGGTAAALNFILSDIVPLQERGLYSAMIGITWCVGGGIGPVIGGAFTQAGLWRWVFFIVLPFSGLATILGFIFCNLPVPQGSFQEKLRKVDWIGTVIVACSTIAVILALTWGGVQFSWNSSHVLAPLVVGVLGFISFFIYEFYWAHNPLVPLHVLANRTSFSGYLQTFILSMPLNALTYYLPVYFQGCHGASPKASGVDILGLSFTVAPICILSGISISRFKKYRPQLWVGWSITIIGLGVMSTLGPDSSRAAAIGYQVIVGIGIGLCWTTVVFPVLAPLGVEYNARALALYTFARAFSTTWGIAIGGVILQNQLITRLPHNLTAFYPANTQIAYAIIPQLSQLDPNVRDQFRAAFAQSLARIWQTMIGICGIGLLASLFMGDHPMHTHVDKKWQAQEEESKVQRKSLEIETIVIPQDTVKSE